MNIPRGVLNMLVLMAAMFAIRETDDDWIPLVILLWDSLSAPPTIHMLRRLLISAFFKHSWFKQRSIYGYF